MKHLITILTLLVVSALLPSCRTVTSEALPETQIWMADFDIRTGEVSNAAMVIDAPGYDNQPMFTADSKALLFVSDRDGSGLTDVYRYDLATSSISRLTSTSEQEFSPTPIPGTTDFSVVRVGRPNDTGSVYTESQQLWRYSADGKPLSPVIANTRIGYHTWMDSSWVAVFVVGDESAKQPHRLEILGVDTAASFSVANNIGRCIRRHPSGQLTYVDKSDSTRNVLMVTTGPDTPNQVLVTMPNGAEDYCWLWDTSVLFLSKDGTISRWIKGTELGIQQLTSLYLQGQGARITANADASKLAWVVVKPRSEQ
ncbi:MAG: hypothetical protein FGM33_04475 [Candidatus Kapabacteria bacterium]|nr:hypothetical protein [Candidatus Kapabacteria bacterium]